MPRELTIAEIEEIVDKFASRRRPVPEGGLRRHRPQCGEQPPAAQFPLAFLEQAHRRLWRHPGKPCAKFVVEIIKEIKKRAGQDFAVQVIINGLEMGQAVGIDNSKCMTVEYSKNIARILAAGGC